MTAEQVRFDLVIVHENFSNAIHEEEEDIHLENYLNSYEELNKFFNLMGAVFGFVSKDLKSKIDTLVDLQKQNESNFKTVKKMMEYEKHNNLLHKNGYTSGSRTLLRLHRALDFIRLFLKSVGELKNEDSTASVCRQAYDNTLAKHHPFLIRKGAQVAMYTMPTRQDLLRKVCGNDDEHIQNTINILPKTLEVSAVVHQRIENLYTLHSLHNLP
ncbi:glycolipid transfer protein-related [Holotrichia oblita]|uniref:Glycolipid transfer protein-related n=1 Tax=Holotrichia oblita TaxID=644536 RepID=A0ACB9TDT7_HOLOL|nr:glycolipid transfer protein-related [Holotrichia oblita]